MNKWSLEFEERAVKELKNLDKPIANFILAALEEFIINFSHDYEKELIKTGKIKHLKGSLSGLYRLRLRSFRIVYEKLEDRLIIYVLSAADRKDVYKKLNK
ncbi:type II toxin-antitoxin system RelE family toxin [Campylobacter sp. RM16192]|uniref:type II toxin-antitoxin system RelE family toxin n=1 Tax=Campylobacter sp. RM16192 TaxID=1660080 RepID=UPI00145279FF|nr:type II toxin-antitoxin system RelE/ParE family toxin [Campylobacter sp. RM16192]QCD52501.1 toxin-antitoxin system, toxin component, RelE/ParE family [Campylobacter sp. RM16192]